LNIIGTDHQRPMLAAECYRIPSGLKLSCTLCRPDKTRCCL